MVGKEAQVNAKAGRAAASLACACALALAAFAPSALAEPAASGSAAAGPQWERLAGLDAFGTMQEISKAGWADASSDTVIVATSNGYWDALAASPLAGEYRAPVLLTRTDSLSVETKAEIERLQAKHVYICGGELAVSRQVEDEIASMPGVSVVRLAGKDAVGTANEIAQQIDRDTNPHAAVIATSNGYWDALSFAPFAYFGIMPVFLTDANGNLSDETLELIAESGVDMAYIAGGPLAVSSDAESKLLARGFESDSVIRIGGKDAWETSAMVAQHQIGIAPARAEYVGVADGNGYHDALTGSALVGKMGGVLLLVPHDGDGMSYNPFTIDNVIKPNASRITQGHVFGGNLSVPDATFDAILKASK